MAEHEFERFLEVLSKLLKLSSKETAAVADEICDHLEERYSELVSLGISRDDAVKQALDEFDDAGEFASKINQLVRQRTRRRIMTGAFTTAAASALAILVTTAFWPDHRPGQGAAVTAIAQEAGKKPAEIQGDNEIVYIDYGRFLPETFRKPVDVDLNEVELEAFAKYVQELTGYPVRIDTTELTNAGVSPDQKLNLKTFHAPIYLVMDRAFQDVGGTELAWDLDDEVIYFTTREKADTLTRAQTVDVSALLDGGFTMTDIIQVLEQHTTGPWMDIDGDGGGMIPLGTRLTFGQRQRGRFEILSLLEGLKTPGRRIAVDQPELDRKIHNGLAARVTCDFRSQEFADVLEDLGRQAGVPIFLDRTELMNAGLTGEEKVTLSLPEGPLQRVLKILLADIAGVELGSMPDSGVLCVSTREKVDTYQHVEIFDVSDLVDQNEMQSVVHLIETAASGPWQNVEGETGTITIVPKQRVVVRQSRSGLESIQRLLAEHRRIAAATPARPKPDPNAVETRYYRMTEAQANDLKTIIPKHVAVDSWRQLPDLSDPAVDKVSVPPGSGVGGGGGFFQLGGMGGVVEPQPQQPAGPMAVLVIRQTRRVHLEIEKFLRELSFKSGTSFFDTVSNGGGLGGFGGGGRLY